jgi:hypothetical protein
MEDKKESKEANRALEGGCRWKSPISAHDQLDAARSWQIHFRALGYRIRWKRHCCPSLNLGSTTR